MDLFLWLCYSMSRFYISFPLTLWDVCMFLSVDTFLPDSLCMIQFLRALLAFHLSFSISASFHLFFSHSLPGQAAPATAIFVS